MMMLELIIVKSPSAVVPPKNRVLLDSNTRVSLSIGRGEENAFCLPDPKRFVSQQHALVVREDENFYVIDQSSNGLYVNAANQPLGHGSSWCLQDGDFLELGEYQLRVDLYSKSAAKEASPLSPGQSSLNQASELNEEKAFSSVLTLLGLDVDLLDRDRLQAAEQLVAILLKESLGGLRQMYVQRARMRGKLSSDATLMQPKDNNPLKFTPNTQLLLKVFLSGDCDEYLPPVTAIREVVAELQAHQLQLEAAGGFAVDYLLGAFSPESIKKKVIEKHADIGSPDSGSFWEAYCDQYQNMISLFDGVSGLKAHIVSEGYEINTTNSKDFADTL